MTDLRRIFTRFLPHLACATALSVYFFAVYCTCNAISARRHDVGQISFACERHIPFVPITIIPYMSIDLLFFIAPFLCRSPAELRTHVKRIVLAISVAGACFLLFPLRMAYSHPPVTGWLGSIFAFLAGFDRPYNLVPSLHIAQGLVLWALFARHTRGSTRSAVHLWFALIFVSTITTYQHQCIDVVTGILLGIVCFYVFPDVVMRTQHRAAPVTKRHMTIGRRYAIGAVVAALAAFLVRPWGLILLWPAVSLGIVAAGYFRVGARIFRKHAGVVPLSTKLVLGPYLLAAWISWHLHSRRMTAFHQVTPGLIIGRRLSSREANQLAPLGVTAVLDLTAEFSEVRALRGRTYLNAPVLDLVPPDAETLEIAVAFIAEQSRSGVVYVHCALGYSRSATVAAAYLLSTAQAATAEQAVQLIRDARPNVVIRAESALLLQS